MSFKTHTQLDPTFDRDIRDLHLIFDYDVKDEDGAPKKWRYELWFFSENRITGSVVSLVYDISLQQITSLACFSQGHWENPEKAHGDKRNPEDFERWRGLAKIGTQKDRFMLAEKAKVLEVFRGKGDLVPIEPD
ncbi:MAG: hypothetical protein Q9191_003351, partial [Dirinaria sp. TL-2023a]